LDELLAGGGGGTVGGRGGVGVVFWGGRTGGFGDFGGEGGDWLGFGRSGGVNGRGTRDLAALARRLFGGFGGRIGRFERVVVGFRGTAGVGDVLVGRGAFVDRPGLDGLIGWRRRANQDERVSQAFKKALD
jgi:hypothetical protein